MSIHPPLGGRDRRDERHDEGAQVELVRSTGQLMVALDWLSQNAWRWVLGPTVTLLLFALSNVLGEALGLGTWTVWAAKGASILIGLAILVWALRVSMPVDEEEG